MQAMTVERPLEIRPPRSFAEAAEAHLDDVFGYLLYLTRDRETAEDLSGSTFEKALTRWDRFDPRGGAPDQLLGCATTALDWFRAESVGDGARRPQRAEQVVRRSSRVSRPSSRPRSRHSRPGSARCSRSGSCWSSTATPPHASSASARLRYRPG